MGPIYERNNLCQGTRPIPISFTATCNATLKKEIDLFTLGFSWAQIQDLIKLISVDQVEILVDSYTFSEVVTL